MAMIACAVCGEEYLERAFTKNPTVCNSCVSKQNAPVDTSEADTAAAREELRELEQRLSRIFISSGPINVPFKVLDVVFAMDSHDEGFFKNILQQAVGIRVAAANPTKAFDKVKLQLRAQCHAMGGDAVINCQFEHRVAVSNTIPGLSVGAQLIPGLANKQVVEILAYGTVVKLL